MIDQLAILDSASGAMVMDILGLNKENQQTVDLLSRMMGQLPSDVDRVIQIKDGKLV